MGILNRITTFLFVYTNIVIKFEVMSDKSDTYCSCLYFSANAFSRALTRIAEEEFSITGIAPSYAFVLMTINDSPGIHPMAISEIMMLNPSTITRFIEKLEARGYLTREIKGKFTEVYPTDKSRRLQVNLHKAWENLFRRYAAVLGESHSRLLTMTISEATKKLGSK